MTILSKLKDLFKKGKNTFTNIPFHYLVIILAVIIICITAGILLTSNTDNEKPSLEVITKHTAVYEGEIATITVNFSDNDKVDIAKIYYKKENDKNFTSKSILNKTVDIQIPTGSGEDWEYYVVVDDPAKNGPVGDPSIDGNKTYKIYVLTKNDETDNSSNDADYKRHIFIEECSSESCHNCPDVAKSLHELFDSGKYNFHYVTLVEEHDNSSERMQDYNVIGKPVVFVDGGYQVLLGKKDKEDYENAIKIAQDREPPDIKINLTAVYNPDDEQISITTVIINDENTKYRGKLRVYLAEISSTKYQDSNGNPYNNSFLEFAVDEDITIEVNNEKTKSKTIDGKKFDPENLIIYAVVFSNEKHEKYQDDQEEKYPFNAYYVDACTGVQVVEGGNLPPRIGITFPKNGKVYLMGKQIKLLDWLTLERTVLFGKCNFTITASERNNDIIEKVEVYIDDKLVKTIGTSPYYYNYKNLKLLSFKHTITFIAYDSYGKDASASLDIFAITLKEKS